MMLPSRLGCPLSLETANMGNPGQERPAEGRGGSDLWDSGSHGNPSKKLPGRL